MGSDRRAAALLLLAAAAAACSKRSFEAPPLADEPRTVPARRGEVPLSAPVYGIVLARDGRTQLEVNVEAADAPRVREGDACVAYLPPAKAATPCVVARVLRGASAETGSAIAWLEPRGGPALAAGEFVFAMITTRVKKGALVVPAAAVLTKNGGTYVVRRTKDGRGGERYEPVEVTVGESAGGEVEISAGLTAGDEAVVQGGLGYLYPDFKAGAGD